jgi:TonB family protein
VIEAGHVKTFLGAKTMKKIILLLAILGTICLADSAPERCVVSMDIPGYPALARTARIQGVVQIRIEINEAGEVTNAKPLSGHPMLQENSITNVKTWRFYPAAKPTSQSVTYRYNLDDEPGSKVKNACRRIKLDLPYEVEIFVEPVMIETNSAKTK